SFSRGCCPPLACSSPLMLTRPETPPRPNFPPERSASGPRTLTRTGEKSTQGERTGFAATGDATCPCPRSGKNWNRKETSHEHCNQESTDPHSIGVGRTDWFRPLPPPNRAGGFPAHGSPVSGLV